MCSAVDELFFRYSISNSQVASIISIRYNFINWILDRIHCHIILVPPRNLREESDRSAWRRESRIYPEQFSWFGQFSIFK